MKCGKNQKYFSIITSILLISSIWVHSNTDYHIETSDIANFWHAFEMLNNVMTKQDSIDIIQKQYLDKASTDFREFIKIRNFTAAEYVEKIGRYPLYWRSIKPRTENIEDQLSELDNVVAKLEAAIPNYRQPNICFAIGCLRTGGTTSENLVLIGAEIAAADDSVEKSELPPWLRSIIGKTGGIISLVAHEIIHTQQIDRRIMNFGSNPLLEQTIKEGVADFLTFEILGLNINQEIHNYGMLNECSLLKEFEADLKSEPKDYTNWLYNGGKMVDRPANLGYFIGFKIAESYYQKQTDKSEAIRQLLNQKEYSKIYKESAYLEKNCG